MKKLMSVFLMIYFTSPGYAQKKTKPDTTVYNAVEVNPEFPGGDRALNKYLFTKIRIPKTDDTLNFAKRTVIQFVVEKNGSLSNFSFLKGSKLLSDQLIKLMRSSPKWTPGLLKGKIASAKKVIAIQIELGE
jgi:protein TonB